MACLSGDLLCLFVFNKSLRLFIYKYSMDYFLRNYGNNNLEVSKTLKIVLTSTIVSHIMLMFIIIVMPTEYRLSFNPNR